MSTDHTPYLHQSLSRTAVFGCLLLLEVIYDLAVRHMALPELLWLAPLHAVLYGAVLWLVMALDLARLTLVFLAIPYFIFFIGWLNIPAAVTCSLLFLYCLQCAQENAPSVERETITLQHLLGYILLLAWLHLSGIGGYGYQSYDYTMHNARLNDLVQYTWPVRYENNPWGNNLNLVYYLAYFLPAAAIGKFTSFAVAWQVLFLWSLFSMALVLRWLGMITGTRSATALALLFILFGPQDLFGVLTLFASNTAHEPQSLAAFLQQAWGGDKIEFWASDQSPVFLGGFLSNTSQLFWSPPQVIAGWLASAVLYFLFTQRHYRVLVFAYSLLLLWAPFPMLALLPVLLVASVPTLRSHWRAWLSTENILAPLVLLPVIGSFYLAGSALDNPSQWAWAGKQGVPTPLRLILLLYLFGWGLYAIACAPALAAMEKYRRWWFLGVLLALFLLPLRTYGAYNDLVCRGAAPLMFLLLVLVLQVWQYYRQQHRTACLLVLAILLCSGTMSALSQLSVSVQHNGETRAIEKVTAYRYARECLGPDGTFFEKYLRKHRD